MCAQQPVIRLKPGAQRPVARISRRGFESKLAFTIVSLPVSAKTPLFIPSFRENPLNRLLVLKTQQHNIHILRSTGMEP
jgi:hypothetical protein